MLIAPRAVTIPGGRRIPTPLLERPEFWRARLERAQTGDVAAQDLIFNVLPLVWGGSPESPIARLSGYDLCRALEAYLDPLRR